MGEDLVDWLDADPEELDRGMEDRGKVQASGQFDLMRFWGIPGPSVWAVIRIAGEVFAEAYEPKGIEDESGYGDQAAGDHGSAR